LWGARSVWDASPPCPASRARAPRDTSRTALGTLPGTARQLWGRRGRARIAPATRRYALPKQCGHQCFRPIDSDASAGRDVARESANSLQVVQQPQGRRRLGRSIRHSRALAGRSPPPRRSAGSDPPPKLGGSRAGRSRVSYFRSHHTLVFDGHLPSAIGCVVGTTCQRR
jgi:hypothetical protein